MVHQLSGGAWGVVIRRPIGAASRVLPVLTLLFLPIVARHAASLRVDARRRRRADEMLQHKQLYLNTPFFLVRAAIYFCVWNALSYFLNAWSLEQDRTGDPRLARRMQMLSGGGLLAYGLTITFASFDWLMSLEPHWFSTIYGVLIMGGQGLSALAFLIIVAGVAQPPAAARSHRRARALPRPRQPDARLRDAVGVLLVLAVPDHLVGQPAGGDQLVPAPAADRLAAGRRCVLVVFHFAVPFVAAAVARVKRAAELLVKVAAGILVAAPGRSVLADRAGVPPATASSVQLAGRRAAARRSARSGSAASSGSCAAARFCRCTIPQFDEALGDDHRARRAAGTAH